MSYRLIADLDEEIEDIPELVIEEEEEEEEAATNPLLEAAGANKYEDVEKQKAARLGAENIARAQKGEEAMQPGVNTSQTNVPLFRATR